MKVIAREGAWASSYFRTAINHCIEADQILERVLATDDLSEQSILNCNKATLNHFITIGIIPQF